MRLWIDTDIGSDVDDALTLGYALRHAGFDLVGVSTVFGDVALRTRIAERLLEIGGAPEVPVLTGLGVPISPGRKGVMFGHEGLGLFEDPRPVMRVEREEGGEQRIDALGQAVERAAPDVMLAIGPLSNLGALVHAGVALPSLAIMGGKLRDVTLPGMIPQIPEWNWYCDPLAVEAVLAAEAKALPRVVPGEVTFTTYLTADDVERLQEGDALAQALHTLCGHWLDKLSERAGGPKPRVALHDPLTAATLVEPDMCPFEPRSVAIDADNGGTSDTDAAPNLEAATAVDNERLRVHLMSTWMSS